MDVQISYRIYAEIPAESDLQPVQREHRPNTEAIVWLQGSRDNRGAPDGGSCTHVGKHPAQDQRIEFYGISEREECTDDI